MKTPKRRASEVDRTVGILNEAARLHDVELFDYLVSRGADHTRSLALHMACGKHEDDPEGVKCQAMLAHLIDEYGFDINAPDETPGLREYGPPGALHPPYAGPPRQYAVYHDNAVALKFLIERSAKPVPGSINIAIRWKRHAVLAVLLDEGKGDVDDALEYAVQRDDMAAAEMCLEHGADPVAAEKYSDWMAGENGKVKAEEMGSDMRSLLAVWKEKWTGSAEHSEARFRKKVEEWEKLGDEQEE
jgi:hypothetical protein